MEEGDWAVIHKRTELLGFARIISLLEEDGMGLCYTHVTEGKRTGLQRSAMIVVVRIVL